MAEKRSDEELLKQLTYTDPLTGERDLPVTGWPVIRQSLRYTPAQMDLFWVSLTLSAQQLDDAIPALEMLERLRKEVNGPLALNRLFQISPQFALRSTGVSNGQRSDIIDLVREQLREEFTRSALTIGQVVIPEGVTMQEVRVEDVYDVRPLRTLRSVSDPVYRSHKGQVRFTITLDFTASTMNTVFRRLLAHLRVAPVCEISMDALSPVFINAVLRPEAARRIRERINENVRQTPGSYGKEIREVLTLRDSDYGQSVETFGKLVGNLDPLVEYFDQQAQESDELVAPQDEPRLANARRDTAIVGAFAGLQISTLDGATNTFRVELMFAKIDDALITRDRLLYRDKEGNPTTDVFACPWIEVLAQMMYLRDTNEPAYEVHYLKPYSVPAENEPMVRFVWEDPETKIRVPYVPDPTKMVLLGVEAGVRMKMRQLPIVGSPRGTCQYLGADNVVAQLRFASVDPLEVASLHEMKDALDDILFRAGSLERNHRIKVDNAVLGLLGAEDFVIQGVQTVRNSETHVHELVVNLVESRISPAESERIVLLEQDEAVTKDARLVWEHIYNLLTIRHPDTGAFTTPETMGHLEEDYQRDVQLAYDIVFGVDRTGHNTHVDMNAMAAYYWLRLMRAGNNDRSPSDWNTDRSPAAVRLLFESSDILYRRTDGQAVLIVDDLSLTNVAGAIKELFVYNRFESPVVVSRHPLPGPQDPMSLLQSSQAGALQRLLSLGRSVETDSPVTGGPLSSSSTTQFISAATAAARRNLPYLPSEDTDTVRLPWPVSRGNSLLSGGETLLGEMARSQGGVFFTREAWMGYFDLVTGSYRSDNARHPAWTSADLARARSSVMALLLSGRYMQFSTLSAKRLNNLYHEGAEVVVSNPSERLNKSLPVRGRLSNYADMRLPTYRQVFTHPLVAGETRAMPTVSDSSDVDLHTEMWLKFAPTYSDLGRAPPYDLSLLHLSDEDASAVVARTADDTIEPDFIYFHERVKPLASQGELERVQRMDRIRAYQAWVAEHTVHLDLVDSHSTGQGFHALWRTLLESPADVRHPDQANKQPERERIRDWKEGKKKPLLLVSHQHRKVAVPVRNRDGGDEVRLRFVEGIEPLLFNAESPDTVLNPLSSSYFENTLRSMIDRFPDRRYAPIRLFPAYRLYFIEEDSGKRYMADDLYGINCVVSLSLRKEKNAPDVLTVEISNVTDNLGQEEILTYEEQEKLGLKPDDEGEQYFRRLKIQPGVTVQLRMGYGSRPDDLEVVFTGMTTEVSPGKLLTIVAQGHKRELFNEVQFVQKGEGYFGVLQETFRRLEHPHLGEQKGVGELSRAALRDFVGPGVNLEESYSFYERLMNKSVSSVGRNVFLSSSAPLEGSSFPDVVGMGSSGWYTPPQPGWEVVQEVVRHNPPTIAAVVPQGTKATLFVGRPDQLYRAEEVSPALSAIHTRFFAARAQARENELLEPLLLPFLSSSNVFWREYLGDPRDADPFDRGGVLPASALGPGTSGQIIKPEDDLTGDWDYLASINPELIRELLLWYYDLPRNRAANNQFDASWVEMRQLMLGGDTQAHKDYVSALEGGYTQLGFDLEAARLPLPTTQTELEYLAAILGRRVDAGVITREERDEALERRRAELRGEATNIPLHRNLGDTNYDHQRGRDLRTLDQLILRTRKDLRLFIHQFAQHVRSSLATLDAVQAGIYGPPAQEDATTLLRERAETAARSMRGAGVPPGWRVFRELHHVRRDDIIENEIVASMAEMANTVAVRCPQNQGAYPGEAVKYNSASFRDPETGEKNETVTVRWEDVDWITYPVPDGLPFNERIGERNRKLAVVMELNALDDAQKSRTLLSNMAEVLRPMYRGRLLLTGRPIKPHDVIWLEDPDKDVFGPVCVSTVTHHFSADTGWVTEVEPEAVVEVENPTFRLQVAEFVKYLDWIDTALGVLDTALLAGWVVGLVASGGSAAGGALGVESLRQLVGRIGHEATRKVVIKIIENGAFRVGQRAALHLSNNAARYMFAGATGKALEISGRNILNRAIVASLGSSQLPISVMPLSYRGLPFVAGMEIDREDVYSLSDRFEGFFEDFVEGMGDWWSGLARQLQDLDITDPDSFLLPGVSPEDRLDIQRQSRALRAEER